MNCSKKIILLALLSLKLVALSESQKLEAIFRKVLDIEKKQADILPIVRSIQTNMTEVVQQTASKGFVSMFGESVSSGVRDHLNIQFQYGLPSLDVSTSLVNTGTVFAQNRFAVVSTGTDPNGAATLTTIDFVRYRSGHEAYAFFTAIFTVPGAANSTQLIGMFDDNDGAAVGFNGTQFSLLFRKDGNPDLFIAQSDFNMDPLDGTGPSGFNLNPAYLNLFRISYGWLGAAPIKFQILSSNGTWITFHLIQQPNSVASTSFGNAILPIRAQVINNGNTSNMVLQTPSWNGGIVAGPTTPAHKSFAESSFITVASSNTETHLITIQNKTMFQGAINKTSSRLKGIGGGGNDFSNNPTIIRVYRNATVTGTSFSDVDTQNSVMAFSTVGTFVPSGVGALFLLASNTYGSGPRDQIFASEDFNIIFAPGETMTLTAECIGSSGIEVIGTITWEDLF